MSRVRRAFGCFGRGREEEGKFVENFSLSVSSAAYDERSLNEEEKSHRICLNNQLFMLKTLRYKLGLKKSSQRRLKHN